jgi:hypothetical protein
MSIRFRKRLKLMPGVYLNISKTGFSLSWGRPGVSLNVSKKGLTGTVGLPGTGLSYQKKVSEKVINKMLSPKNEEE